MLSSMLICSFSSGFTNITTPTPRAALGKTVTTLSFSQIALSKSKDNLFLEYSISGFKNKSLLKSSLTTSSTYSIIGSTISSIKSGINSSIVSSISILFTILLISSLISVRESAIISLTDGVFIKSDGIGRSGVVFNLKMSSFQSFSKISKWLLDFTFLIIILVGVIDSKFLSSNL